MVESRGEKVRIDDEDEMMERCDVDFRMEKEYSSYFQNRRQVF
jgi:hypothetical protein